MNPLLLLAFAALPMVAAGEDHAKPDHAKDIPTAVIPQAAATANGLTVAPVASRAVARPVTAPARVVFDPDAQAHIGSVVAGRVAKVHVRVGDVVKAGDALIDVDSPELGRVQSEFVQRQAALTVAKANLTIAEQAWTRAQALVGEQVIAIAEAQRREGEFKRGQTGVMAAEADVQAAANALHVLGIDAAARGVLATTGTVLPRLTIRSPIAGTVIRREVTIGEAVNAERDALLVIADTSNLWVLVDIPEALAGAIRAGDRARITAPGLVGGPLDAVVSQVATTVDPATRSVQVRVVVPGGSGLRAGAFAEVTITPVASGKSAVVIPRSALFTWQSMPAVFVPGPIADTYQVRTVTVGEPIGDEVPVLSGLKDGERAVIAGGFLIKAELGKSGAKGCCDGH